MPTDARRYGAIALVSATVILLQITLTRILSVVVWYHWAFFSISLAMLGLGVPGVWLSFSKDRERWLAPLLLGAAVMVPAGVIAILRGAHLLRGYAILFCLIALLPAMLCLGGAVCVLLVEARGQAIGRMYAFDLLGAFVGAAAVIPLMTFFPTPEVAGALGLLPLSAYLLVGGRRLAASLTIASALVFTLALHEPFRVTHSKLYSESTPLTRPSLERWTPTARISVFDRLLNAEQAFGWGFGNKTPRQRPPHHMWIDQDGSSGTPITQFEGDLGPISYLYFDVTSVAYQFRPPERVAVVGAGGGRDVLTAKLAGARAIDAIELNPAIVEIVRDDLRHVSGGVYDLPGVRTIIGEGRSVLARSEGGYDLIQISLIDSWAATAAGAFAFSENNLYTLEAFRLYWSKLSADGMLSISRWTNVGMEFPRLLFLAHAALRAEGVHEVDDHVAVLQGGRIATVIISRRPLDAADAARLHGIAHRRGFALHLPMSNLPVARQWVRRLADGGPSAFARAGLRMDPPTDDRPFFFQVLSPFDARSSDLGRTGVNADSIVVLRMLMITMSVLTILLFFGPFALSRWMPRGHDFWRGSAFFTAIGLAFLLVEIAWVQRLILYLGHPSHATTVGIGTLLLGAGLGSMASARVGVRRVQRFGFVLPIAVGAINASLAGLFAVTIGWSLAARIGVAVAWLLPVGALMGLFFPSGMVRFGDSSRPWFWALNGAAGVLASVLSLALAMEFGFMRVALAGGSVYVVAWLLLRGEPKRSAMSGARATEK